MPKEIGAITCFFPPDFSELGESGKEKILQELKEKLIQELNEFSDDRSDDIEYDYK